MSKKTKYTKKRSYKKRAYKKRSTSRKVTIPTNIKKYVKSVVARNVENKLAVPLYSNNRPITGYGISPNGPHQLSTFDIGSIFNGIIQGTNNGQRIGDSIRVKKYTLKGYVNLDSSVGNDTGFNKNPLYVKMFVGRRQDGILDPNTFGATAFGDLLVNGPTASAPLNLPSDMWRLINKNVYRIYATRFFKIGMSAPSNNPADSNQWNNDFKFSKHFSIDLSKHIDIVKYDEGGNTPRNISFHVWFLVCFANGSPMTSLTQPCLEWHYDVNASYEDA